MGLKVEWGCKVVSVSEPADDEKKKVLAQMGEAVDMETFFLARRFSRVGAVRIISDEPGEEPFEAWRRRLPEVRKLMRLAIEALAEVLP